MPLTTAQVWTVLDRYFDLRRDCPIASTLGQVSGASHVESRDLPPRLCFVVDVGVALELLSPACMEAVEVAYHTRRAMEDAEASARNADHAGRWTSLTDVRSLSQRSRREWRAIAGDHRKELDRIRHRKTYTEAMDTLANELELMVLLGKLAKALAAV